MTICDYDKRENKCPVCKTERLIFITDAPKIRPVGKSVQYRCKDCATEEATTAGDPIELVRHCERRHVPPAWNSDRRPQPKFVPPPRGSKVIPRQDAHSASGASDGSGAIPAPEARRMGAASTVEEEDEE